MVEQLGQAFSLHGCHDGATIHDPRCGCCSARGQRFCQQSSRETRRSYPVAIYGFGNRGGVGGRWWDYGSIIPALLRALVSALVYILYAAGFDTHASELRQQMWIALSLATIGVFVSCLAMAAFSHYVFGSKWASGVLLGAVFRLPMQQRFSAPYERRHESKTGLAAPH